MNLPTFLRLLLLGLLICPAWAQAAFWHKPPGLPVSGYGSPERHITDTYTEYRFGSASAGDQTWYYVPDRLKYGERAPVVVFLHGFAALYPELYRTHIDHLVAQGNIVIFPQFQKATLLGFLAEAGMGGAADQNLWARRAVASVQAALELLGEQADHQALYLYGHSLGGLIALAWQAEGGIEPRALVLSHPQVNSQEGIPPFVRALLTIVEIPWREYAPAITEPVVILNGDEDRIAPLGQSEEILSLLQSAPSKVLYVAQRDCFGYPCVSPNHGAPLDVVWGLPPYLKLFGMSGELDGLDGRFYFAALDAVMEGQYRNLAFDLGSWSNGRPVRSVRVLSPD